MSIIPQISCFKRRSLFPAVAVFASCVFASMAATPGIAAETAGEVTVWNAEAKNGQWRAFGLGVLDSQTLSGGGLSLDVNWEKATFGVGVSYARTEEGGVPLPSLADYKRLRFEARAVGEESRTVTIEWVVRPVDASAREKAFRASEGSAKSLAGEWAEVEFEIRADFPRIDAVLGDVNALRILFPKSGSEGRGRVEFRNVRLVK